MLQLLEGRGAQVVNGGVHRKEGKLRSYRIRGDVKAARLTTFVIMRARWLGRRDGRKAVTLPDTSGGHGAVSHADEAWTPFIAQARDSARATSSQMIAWLLDTNKDLARTIYRQAETVVRQHAGDGCLDGARGRFVASLSTWRVEAATARARAEAAVDYANQLIDCYWQAFLVGYLTGTSADGTDRRGIRRWEPGRAMIDPIWSKVDALLLLAYGDQDDETTSQAGRTLRRALDVIADCACPKCNK